jgi:hypothetical protein
MEKIPAKDLSGQETPPQIATENASGMQSSVPYRKYSDIPKIRTSKPMEKGFRKKWSDYL